MTKTSDFKLAMYLLKLFCKQHHSGFVDVPIRFDDQSGFSDGIIHVKRMGKWGQTVFQIISAYISGFETITGIATDLTDEERTQFLNIATTLIRDCVYAQDFFPESVAPKPTITRLNRQAFPWFVLRDIIVPVYQVPLQNIKIAVVNTDDVDAAQLFDRDQSFVRNVEYPLLLVNLQVENQAIRTAQLLFAAIEAHDLDAVNIGRQLLVNESLRQQFIGLVKVAMESRENVNNFLTYFAALCEFEDTESLLEQQKTARWNGKQGLWSQAQYDPSGWWYIGLLEKMLDGARGPDWSGYYTLKPFTDELWNKVDEEKKRRGLPTLPLEALLRVQSEEYRMRGDLTIQGLLADNRVW